MINADLVLLGWFGALSWADRAPSPVVEDEVQSKVDAARRGERSAWSALYEVHAAALYRAVRPVCRSEAETEDVVQEAFVRAFERLGGYRRRAGARFLSWLVTIAIHVEHRRRRWHGRTVLCADPPEGEWQGADPGEQLDGRVRKEALLEALAELPPRDREIVSLRYGSGLTAREVAAALGLREANVRKICERARGRLLLRLGELLSPSAEAEGGLR